MIVCAVFSRREGVPAGSVGFGRRRTGSQLRTTTRLGKSAVKRASRRTVSRSLLEFGRGHRLEVSRAPECTPAAQRSWPLSPIRPPRYPPPISRRISSMAHRLLAWPCTEPIVAEDLVRNTVDSSLCRLTRKNYRQALLDRQNTKGQRARRRSHWGSAPQDSF